ncbi:MAG TPA: hypothetical protein DHW64_04970 [Chitinophagaceae bacterium]|nr:hypothetical protein [Chitinophagaceae bacterium]
MKTITYMACLAILLSIACNSAKKDQLKAKESTVEMQFTESATVDTTYTVPQMVADEKAADNMSDPGQKKNAVSYQDWDKKLIKTANITVEAANYPRFDQDIRSALKRHGAYIASEEQVFSDDRKQNMMTIKVPVLHFESLLGSFGSDSNRVIQKNISTEDVTSEMYDSKSRIEARKKIRERYVQLLQQAKKMDDVLKVEQEINNIQEELESAAGRLNYLSHQTSYSTIHLTYFTLVTASPTSQQPNAFWNRLKEGFADGGDILVEIIVIAIRLWPLILLGILIGLLWKRKRLQVLKK